MKKIARFPALVVLLVSISASASADPVTVTFDQPPCDAHSPGIYPGTCYVGVGLFIWSTRPEPDQGVIGPMAFLIAADPNAVSAPNVARPVAGFTALEAQFREPGGFFGTRAVSFNVVGSGAALVPWRVEFYGTDDELGGFAGFGDGLVSSPAGVGTLLGLRFFPGTALRAIDNLAFTFNGTEAPIVPEPATLLLTGSGILAVARRRWLMNRLRRPAA